ncbi:MAG TPA: HAMP domain-containing sensor histidine kinase [Planctomycetota bacterium]
MLALLRSRLSARLTALFLAVSLAPILGAAFLFARTLDEAARGERLRRQQLLAERCAALADEHVERAHAKLRTVARLFAEDGSAGRGTAQDELVARLQERVDPPDAFLELQFFAAETRVVGQARQKAFDAVQQLGPDAFARNVRQLEENRAAPLVQAPLNLGQEWRAERLETIEGFPTLTLSVPVARHGEDGALVAYVDFAPLAEQLTALAGAEYALELADRDGTLLAAVGTVAGPTAQHAWNSPGGWSVEVSESLQPSLASARDLRRKVALWVALAAALTLVTSLALSAWITRPIARLERAAERLAHGDFGASAGIAREDELGRLALAFDRMTGALSELDRAKSEFVANVSHELRTPLTSLKLSVANLLDGVVGELDEAQRGVLRRVQGELERLIRLVNQLLEMARLEAGAVEPRRERVELLPVAEAVVASLTPLAGERGLVIAVEGAGAVLADRAMVERILVNLLDNAIKFSPAGSRIEIALSARGLRVQDQGPGLQTSFTFEPFRQGQQHGVKNPGVGLGLAIVRKLVELNRGRIRVEPGAGATLVVELPSA